MARASECSFSGSPTAKPRPLVRSRASPTRHPASLPEISPPWTLTLSGGLPCPQRSGGRTPPRRPREALPAPLGTPPGACPLKRRGAVARDAPHPGHSGRQAEQGGLASAADWGNPGKSPQRRKAPQKLLRERRTHVGRSRRACRTPAAPSIAARGRACPKGPENGLGAGSCADASAPNAIAATDAPQERRRGCTRTPRRRRRSGWTRP